MSDDGRDMEYFLARSRQETAMAEKAANSCAAAAHRELAMRYSIRAQHGRSGEAMRADAGG